MASELLDETRNASGFTLLDDVDRPFEFHWSAFWAALAAADHPVDRLLDVLVVEVQINAAQLWFGANKSYRRGIPLKSIYPLVVSLLILGAESEPYRCASLPCDRPFTTQIAESYILDSFLWSLGQQQPVKVLSLTDQVE